MHSFMIKSSDVEDSVLPEFVHYLFQNVAANHRGNDVIVREGAPQSIQARFMYGPLDMVALSGRSCDSFPFI